MRKATSMKEINERRQAEQRDANQRARIRSLERFVADVNARRVDNGDMTILLRLVNSSEELHARMKGGVYHKRYEIYINAANEVTVVMKTPGLYLMRQNMLKQGWRKISQPDVCLIKGW